MDLPPDLAERLRLADEVHARPPVSLTAPCRVSYVAVFFGTAPRDAEAAHLAALCRDAGVEPPPASATHFAGEVGAVSLKWERHGEFSGYTVVAPGDGHDAATSTAAAQLPEGWLAAIPGRTLVAAHARVVARPEHGVDAAFLERHFEGRLVVGGEVGDGAAVALSDFRVRDDGWSRFVLVDAGLTPRQTGRMLQRLFEIEAYRMMALLALPLAQQHAPTLAAVEADLAALTIGSTVDADGTDDDEAILHTLSALPSRVERAIAATQFRFGACRAYDVLVSTRIAELRERRIAGVQTIGEFMARRFAPAVATCATVSQRLHDASERIARASSLLATRVGIARERQNQSLLASMDRRAKMQLRLQETVETLSIAAIVYYAAGLVGYVAKAAKSSGLHVDPDVAVGIAILVLAIVVIWAMRRARQHVLRDLRTAPPAQPGR